VSALSATVVWMKPLCGENRTALAVELSRHGQSGETVLGPGLRFTRSGLRLLLLLARLFCNLLPSCCPRTATSGLSLMGVDLSAKRLQLLKDAIPRLARVAVLWNPATPFHGEAVRDIKTAAHALSINVTLVAAEKPADFGPALSAAKQAHAQALYVVEDPVFTLHRRRLLDITAKARLPSIYSLRDFPDEGGFISYGADLGDMFRRSAQYVDRILKGAKPSDLPIQQPTRFELVINLKTAQALGVAIPESILLSADEVIR